MEHVDGVGHGAPGGDLRVGCPAVQDAVVRNVTQGIDVAVPLVVIVDADVVLGEAQAPGSDVDVGQQRHLVIRRVRVVTPRCVLSVWPTDTVSPLRTSPAAAAIRSAVR